MFCRNLRLLLPLAPLLLGISACALYFPTLPTQAPSTPPVLVPTVEQVEQPIEAAPTPVPPTAVMPVPVPTEQDRLPRTQYDLRVSFDYDAHRLAVRQSIQYSNQVGEALTDLRLVVRPLRWAGSFNLESLAWADGTPVAGVETEGHLLHIPLPEVLEPGGQVGLRLVYELQLPELPPGGAATGPELYGYTWRQANLVDWYPYLPPYHTGKGWLAHEAAYFGEYLVYETADYQVEISLAEPVPGLVLAGSGAAMAAQDGQTYSFSLNAGRAFAWSASPQYQALSAQVGRATVTSYFFPSHALGGQAALEVTAQALALYAELFGEYAHPSLAVVEADFVDGMEYSGMYFLSRDFYDWYDGSPRGLLTTIAAHETAHQWWFEQVGSDQALEPWLDEALCTYMERLFYERLEAQSPTGEDGSLVDWWWRFRVDYYQPTGWVDGTIYDYEDFLQYRDAVYLRGAKFLEALRGEMGEAAFLAFLQEYARQMGGRLATAEDFFSLLEEYAPGGVEGLREEYFGGRGG